MRGRMENPALVAGIAFGVLAYAVFLGFIIYFSSRWTKRNLKKKADALVEGLGPSATQTGKTGEPTIYGGAETEYDVGGRRVLVNTYFQNRSWVRATLRIAAGPFPWLVVYPEGKVDRFGKAIGLNHEVQSGDRAFDELAYLDTSDTAENIQRVVSPPEVRAAMTQLLGLGYKVQLSVKGVEAFQLVYGLDKVDGSKAVPAVEALGRLADALPPFALAELKVPRPARQTAFGIGLATSWALGFLVLGLCNGAIDTTLNRGLIALVMALGGGLVWLLYVAGLIALVRGRSYAFRIVLFGGLFALLGIPAGGGAALLRLNQALDGSAAVAHTVTVLKHTQLDDACRLTVPGWDGRGDQRLTVHHKDKEQLKPGMTAVVRLHPGAFGWEWYDPINPDGT